MHRSAKADTALFRTLADNLFQAGKCTAADKQDVGGIHLNKILIRVLAPTLRRYGCHRAFNQFQQSLLHALARHIAGNRGVVALTGNLVDFVNINNPFLRLFHIKIAIAQKLGNNLLHVFAHIAGFGKRGGIGHNKRHIQTPCQTLRQQGFARSGGADEQNVGFGQLHIIALFRMAQAFVVVVHRYRQHLFCLLLADNVLVQIADDFGRRRQPVFAGVRFACCCALAVDHVAAGVDTLVANQCIIAFNQVFYFVFRFAAERTVSGFVAHLV